MEFVIIIGAAKSGTTSLFNYLSEHPSICECSVKEPRFFCNDELWANGLEWYKKQWNWKEQEYKYALEATPLYSCFPTFPYTVERMRTSGLKFKFIYILRNPLERIESQLSFDLLYEGYNNGYKKNSGIVPQHLIDYSKYYMQLDKYINIFPKENIKIVDFDDLKNDPINLLLGITQFLGIESYNFQNYNVKHNESTGKFYPHPYWIKLRKNKKLKKAITNIIPYTIRSKINIKLGKVLNENIKLTEKQRQYVIKEIKDDLNLFKEKFKFNIDKWKLI